MHLVTRQAQSEGDSVTHIPGADNRNGFYIIEFHVYSQSLADLAFHSEISGTTIRLVSAGCALPMC